MRLARISWPCGLVLKFVLKINVSNIAIKTNYYMPGRQYSTGSIVMLAPGRYYTAGSYNSGLWGLWGIMTLDPYIEWDY